MFRPFFQPFFALTLSLSAEIEGNKFDATLNAAGKITPDKLTRVAINLDSQSLLLIEDGSPVADDMVDVIGWSEFAGPDGSRVIMIQTQTKGLISDAGEIIDEALLERVASHIAAYDNAHAITGSVTTEAIDLVNKVAGVGSAWGTFMVTLLEDGPSKVRFLGQASIVNDGMMFAVTDGERLDRVTYDDIVAWMALEEADVDTMFGETAVYLNTESPAILLRNRTDSQVLAADGEHTTVFLAQFEGEGVDRKFIGYENVGRVNGTVFAAIGTDGQIIDDTYTLVDGIPGDVETPLISLNRPLGEFPEAERKILAAAA